MVLPGVEDYRMKIKENIKSPTIQRTVLKPEL